MVDNLREDALARRIKGFVGGNRVVWSAKDVASIREHVMSVPESVVRFAPRPRAAPVLVSRSAIDRKLADAGISVNQKTQASDTNFLFTISTADVDLACDTIDPNGFDVADFARNPVVLNSHDSAPPPIATSTVPWKAGNGLMAIALFPQLGVSAASDEIAALVRAKVLRGASVGFKPLKWKFSADPSRPFGIDFAETKLIEWSTCAVPCNSSCLLIGAVSGGKSAQRHPVRRQSGDDARQERMAEARALRRVAGLA